MGDFKYNYKYNWKDKWLAIIILFLKVILNLNESFIDNINPELLLRGSSPTPGAIFAGLYIIFLLIESKSYLKEVTIC